MFQTGSGSVDALGSMQYVFKAIRPEIDWIASASYQHPTTNRLEYRFGSQGIVALTAARPLSKRLTGSLQVKGIHQARSAFFGQPVGAAGMSAVYVSPGLRWNLGRQAVYSLLQLPALTYVNETQLAPRYGFIIGISRTM